MVRHKSSATPVAWLYVGLIVYASLYPFEGWRWPALSPFAFLTLPWPRYWTAFDLLANLLGVKPAASFLKKHLPFATLAPGWPLCLGGHLKPGGNASRDWLGGEGCGALWGRGQSG